MLKQMFLMDTDDPVYLNYLKLKEDLKKNPGCFPFKEVINANTGDLQSNGYQPLTFIRQLASAITYPALLNHPCFPNDVKCKAKEALEHHVSVGSYSATPGVEMFRERLATYFCKRDGGIPCDHLLLFLNGGVTEGVRIMLKMFIQCINNKPPGVMVPSPSYPFGLVEEYGFYPIYYYLNEDKDWTPSIQKMESTLKEARKKCTPRIMIVINPGNPTGSIYTPEQMQEIIKFACKEKLVIFADETYQTTLYGGQKFVSFKKVIHDMGKPYSEMELASFFGLSKGFVGEAGVRSGSMEIVNFEKEIVQQVEKSASLRLCSCTVGQAMMYAFANHPQEGDASYLLWMEETQCILKDLESKAKTLVDALNGIEGFRCKPLQSGYFAFPKITIPKKAVEAGMKTCCRPSTFYALHLLEETGILVVPGDVFGKEEAPHIRISILPSKEKLETIVSKIASFNKNFLKRYSEKGDNTWKGSC